MNNVLEAIAKRSSTRKYKDEMITDEMINQLVEAGLQAPTARNEQEIHITVIRKGHTILDEIEDEKNKTYNNPRPFTNFYYDAPVVMILSADKAFPWSGVDAGIAVENIAIAAQGLNLGSVIIGCIKEALIGEKEEYFATALQYPEGYGYQIAIAVGYKADDKIQHEYVVEDKVSYL